MYATTSGCRALEERGDGRRVHPAREQGADRDVGDEPAFGDAGVDEVPDLGCRLVERDAGEVELRDAIPARPLDVAVVVQADEPAGLDVLDRVGTERQQRADLRRERCPAGSEPDVQRDLAVPIAREERRGRTVAVPTRARTCR